MNNTIRLSYCQSLKNRLVNIFELLGLKIVTAICLLIVGFLISSCTMEKLRKNLFFPWESTGSPQNILTSGKNHLQEGNYTEAGKYFDRIIDDYPHSPEAKEAKFYELLIGIMNRKELPANTQRYFRGKSPEHPAHGFYYDLEGFLFDLVKQLKEEKKRSKDFEKTIESHEKTIESHEKTIESHEKTIELHEKTIGLHKEEIKKLHETTSKLKEKNSKINERLADLNVILNKIQADYQNAEAALKQQRDNYRKMQEIEMRKEEMQRELRELSQ